LEAQVYAGRLSVQKRQWQQALAYYQQAVSLEPKSAELLHSLAVVLTSLGRSAEAEPFARRALQFAPNSVEAHLWLGLALHQQGKFAEAQGHLSRATLKYPLVLTMSAPPTQSSGSSFGGP
jgi:Flp pilus assembly protein TadD